MLSNYVNNLQCYLPGKPCKVVIGHGKPTQKATSFGRVAKTAKPLNENLWKLNDSSGVRLVLREYHDVRFLSHLAADKTYARNRGFFKWRGMKRDVYRYVSKCGKYYQDKNHRQPKCNQQLSRKVYVALDQKTNKVCKCFLMRLATSIRCSNQL